MSVRAVVKTVAWLGRLARETDGVSAVEFALVLPFMAFLFVGGVEMGDALAIDYRTTITARGVADLTTQYVSINNSTMSGILGASTAIISPYSSANIAVTVSEVSIDSSGKATITWSDSFQGVARPVGQAVTLPNAINTPNTSLVWGEVTYSYTPQIGHLLTGTMQIYENVLLYPRLSSSISRINS